MISNNNTGVGAASQAAGVDTTLYLIRSTITNNFQVGVASQVIPPSGTSFVTLSDCLVTNNALAVFTTPGFSGGLYQDGVGAKLYTLGNNTILNNGADFGTISTTTTR